MSNINVRQIEARAEAHKGQVLVFDAAGNADPGLVEQKHLNVPVRKKIAYSQVLENFDTDIGAQPLAETIGDYIVSSFLSTDDTAIYKDIDLGNSYDETKLLFFRYQYAMSSAGTDQVDIELDYDFKGSDFSDTNTYTTIQDYFSPGNDLNFHSRAIQLPVQSGLGNFPKLSVRFSRFAETDVNAFDFRLLSMMIYQEAT